MQASQAGPGAGPAPALSVWRKLGFGTGAAGIGIGNAPISLLLLFYLTEIAGLPPGLAGVVVGLPKIWDIVIDPLLGGAVDRLSRRRGRRAPLAFVSALAYVVALYGLFAIPDGLSQGAVMALAIALLIVSSVAHTAFMVLKLALSDDMSPEPRARTALLAYSGVLSMLLTLVATALVPFLVKWGGDGREGYARMALVIAAAGAATFFVFLLSTHRYPALQPYRSGGEPALWRSIRMTLGNRPFFWLIGFLICLGVSSGLLSAFVPYINQYVLRGGTASLSVLGSIVLISTLIAMPFVTLLARRIGNTATLRLSNWIFLASFPLLWLASYGPLWASWAAVGVFGLGAGGMAVLLQSTVIDLAKAVLPGGVVVSLGIYLGILMAAQKLGQSAGSAGAGFVLELIGFVPGQAAQSDVTLSVLRLGYTLLPFLLSLLGTVCIRRVRVTAEPAA
ncbi:MFS transporter [Solimonas flava]|uniref:MFS transporter n=1 Tax=Solimonas flava TaxID=415849 RepID=UPI000420E1A5|nr:MFS transporter [Solimonas flava]